jgi:hypothetical protein
MLSVTVGAAILAPPFVAFLASPHTDHLGRRWLDTTPWLLEAAGERRRAVLTLPIVEPMGTEGLPMLGSDVLN